MIRSRLRADFALAQRAAGAQARGFRVLNVFGVSFVSCGALWGDEARTKHSQRCDFPTSKRGRFENRRGRGKRTRSA